MSATRKIHVDAVVQNDGLTAIAVVQDGENARPIVAKVLHTSGSVEAEMRAMLLAMEIAEKAKWKNVDFHCDALGVVRMIEGLAQCRPEEIRPLRDRARRYISQNDGWDVLWIKRTFNSCAHTMAAQIMKAYKFGREHGRQIERERVEALEPPEFVFPERKEASCPA